MMSLHTCNISLVKRLTLSLAIALVSSISTGVNAESVYGPVKSSDTLSKIVYRMYTGPISSRKSVMRLIVEENPNAFLKGDMNLLKLNASLILPGDHWKSVSGSVNSPYGVNEAPSVRYVTSDFIDGSAPELTMDQMKARIVSLEAERSSLIEQVEKLNRETIRLEEKIKKLEHENEQSDEQLRILDSEIIRLADLLKNQGNGTYASSTNLDQILVLQEKLNLVQEETQSLRSELLEAQEKLKSNDSASNKANQTIAQLTQENSRLQEILQDSQPGVHYYNESASDYKLSLLSGKLQLPIGLIIVMGALASLMLITLIVTRRKVKSPEAVIEDQRINPFEENADAYSSLLESQGNEVKDFPQSHAKPEENVFKMFNEEPLNPFEENTDADSTLQKSQSDQVRDESHTQSEENVFNMFDEGTLLMDLKLDMAEAYLQVSDFEKAKAILNEVIEGGSELQKRKASRLIKKAA